MTKDVRWLAGLPAPQARYWFGEKESPGSPDAMDSFTFRITGPVDEAALRGALRTVIGRHTALRTLITRQSHRLLTTVLEPDAVGEVLEIRHAAPAEHEQALRAFAHRPFHLDRDLPVRALLVTCGTTDHGPSHLIVSVHHVAFDGWSATVFFSELGAAYRALRHGELPPGDPPSHYERIWRAQSEAETERDRSDLMEWAQDLVGVPDLPLPLSPVPDSPGALGEQLVVLSPRHTGLLEVAARNAATTPNALLLTAWVRALRALTGGSDFAVGLPVSGRTSLASMTAIGCFVSVVPLRFRAPADVEGDGERDVERDLGQTVAGLAKALRFQFSPLERIVGEAVAHDAHRTPLCQAAFVSQEQTDLTLRLDGAESVYVPRLKPESAFEVTLEVWFATRTTARIKHRVDVLDQRRAARLAGLWRTEVDTVVKVFADSPR
ncbi:condensation domain-containing protein [Streptomyces sp. NPDC007971]|uniref:condensation domain-containing protein n=1 Tax=Streptomyces sp. NPDC007971 TaxID=3364799 RepID=UPI0036E33EC7